MTTTLTTTETSASRRAMVARQSWERALRGGTTAVTLAVLVVSAYVLVLVPLAGGEAELGPSMLATALVAAAFPIARHWVDRRIDHFVHGERTEAFDALQRFASDTSDVVDPASLPRRVAETAQRLVDARHAELQLSLPGGRTVRTVWPPDSASDELDLVVQVRHEGTTIGLLSVAKQTGDPLSPADEQLVRRLAQAASVALDNSRLALELREKVNEIAAVADALQVSSARIVVAGESEQRRIEKAIREKVDRRLRRTLGAVRTASAVAVTRQPMAERLLTAAASDTTAALTALRDVAHGIFPPLLVSDGLVPALTSRARRERWQIDVVRVDFDESLLDAECRATAYFALAEIARTASAAAPDSTLTITLRGDGTRVTAELDGPGSTSVAGETTDAELGRALERIDAFGGSVRTHEDGGVVICLPSSVPES